MYYKNLFLVLIFTLISSNPSFFAMKDAWAQEANNDNPVTVKTEELSEDTYQFLNLFGDVFERIREQYVDPVDDKETIENAINGMLISLDPHSSYLNKDSFEDMRVQTKGEFGGLGIEVTMENGLVKVVSPIDETPAAAAGMQSGDLIVELDGEEIMGLTLSEAVDKMRGRVGEPITLTVIREGSSDPLKVEIIRDIIKIRSVRHRVEGGDIGYVRITTFNEQVEANLEKAIQEIKKEAGKDLKGFVLDLRNNPGGLLDQAIYVSDSFLDRGEIVSTRGRDPADTKRANATAGDLTNGMPIVVLINGGSASASEIVAGALQDHHRAIIMGTKSFGKGSVQTIVSLPGHGAMRLTTARYYTPSGRSIQAEGIDPDIIVEPAKVEQIKSKFKRKREGDLRGALVNELADALEKTNNEKDDKDEDTDEDEKENIDYQLDRAADLIRGVAHFSKQKSARSEIVQQQD